MIQQVRGALKGIVAWFVIILLVLAFALWGVPELRHFTQKAPLQIGDVSVSQQKLVNEFNREVNNRRTEGGKGMTRAEAVAQGVDKAIVDRLTIFALLDQEAKRMGVSLPVSEVVNFLKTDDMFKNPATGVFDANRLQSILMQNDLSENELKELLHGDLKRRMILDSVDAGAPPPKALLRALILHEIEQREIAYVVVTDEMAGAAAQPTEKDLAAYYETHKASFRSPEYRTFTAVLLRSADFAARANVPEADLKRAYDVNKARLYETPERRTFYQVTFDKAPDAAKAASEIRAGKPFEAIARERGLTLAAVTFAETPKKEILDPKVADAVFGPTLKTGGVADPVHGIFGHTVVQLVAVAPASTKPFEEVRGAIAAELGKDSGRKALLAAIEKLRSAQDTGATLAEAAREAGAMVQNWGPVDDKSFAPGGAIVADIPGEVLAEAFKTDQGLDTDAIELKGDAGYFFVHVDAVQDEAVRPYKDVAVDVERRWRADEAKTRLERAAKKIKDAVAAGKSLESEAAAFNKTPIVATIPRNATSEALSPDFVKSVFKAGKSAIVVSPVALGRGQVVAQIRKISYARDRVAPQDEAQFGQFIDQQMNRELTEAYIDSLRKDAKIVVDQAAIDAAFGETPQ